MLPKGWRKGIIADIAQVTSGGTPSRRESSYWNGYIPWITTSELKFGVITDTEQKITQEGLDNSSAKIFPKDTLLIAMYGQGKTRGQVAKLGIQASTNQACAALLLKKEYHADFYYHYLINQYENIRELANSGGQKNLSAAIIKSINVLIPPLSEQRKIAKILSTWDKAITTTECLLATSHLQKKALMQQLLTGKKRLVNPETGKVFEGEWEEVKLGDICIVNPKKENEPENGLVSFIPMDAVSESAKLLRKEVKTYSEVSKGFTAFIDGDVLIAKITPCFENGKGARVFGLENGIGFGSTEFHVLRARKNICSQFIYFLTNTSEFRIRGEINMQGSAGQKRVTTDYLKFYKTIIPKKLSEQQKVAAVLTVADKEIELLNTKLSHLKEEKKALMQQLLTGKRRVTIDDTVAA